MNPRPILRASSYYSYKDSYGITRKHEPGKFSTNLDLEKGFKFLRPKFSWINNFGPPSKNS